MLYRSFLFAILFSLIYSLLKWIEVVHAEWIDILGISVIVFVLTLYINYSRRFQKNRQVKSS